MQLTEIAKLVLWLAAVGAVIMLGAKALGYTTKRAASNVPAV